MKRKLVIGIIVLFGIGILRVPILHAVTASYNSTVRIVDSSGNVINGVASAVTALYNQTVRVVDSNGNVIDSFGGSAATIPGPTINVLQPPSGCASCTMVGDDSTDNTTAFNNISTYLQANGGGSIYFPSLSTAGVSQAYLVNSCITLANNGSGTPTSQNNIAIYGDGSYATSGNATSPKGTIGVVDMRCTAKSAVLVPQAGATFTPTAASDSPILNTGGSTATYLIAATSGLAVGQNISITGMTPSGYNCADCTVTALSTNTSITVHLDNTTTLGASSIQGTITIISLGLPQSTIASDQTAGWANVSNTLVIGGDTVTCTGTTSTSFTGCSGGTHNIPVGATIEDSTGATAKLASLGKGTLHIHDLAFMDGGSDCTPFIKTTATVLQTDNVSFYGTAGGTSACNDAYIMGGSLSSASAGATGPFQGYGSYIHGNYFNHMRRVEVLQTFADNIDFAYNTLWNADGTSLAGGAAVECVGSAASSIYNRFSNNYIETPNYTYVFKETNQCSGSTYAANGFYDSSTNPVALFRFDGVITTGLASIYTSSQPIPNLVSDTAVTQTNVAITSGSGAGRYSQFNQNVDVAGNLYFDNVSRLGPFITDLAEGGTGNNWWEALGTANSAQMTWNYQPHGGSVHNLLTLAALSTSATELFWPDGGADGMDMHGASSFFLNCPASASAGCIFESGGTVIARLLTLSLAMEGGATFQSTGGTAPTCASNGGGTCLVAANANCTGSAAPWPQCTGSGTGTVSVSTNNRGEIHLTGATTATTITLTFSASGVWGQAPYCTFDQAGAVASPLAISGPLGSCASTSACIATLASASAADVTYMCQ